MGTFGFPVTIPENAAGIKVSAHFPLIADFSAGRALRIYGKRAHNGRPYIKNLVGSLRSAILVFLQRTLGPWEARVGAPGGGGGAITRNDARARAVRARTF